MKNPIKSGWEQILDAAPSAEARAQADRDHKLLFFCGASWLWTLYCSLDDETELREFVKALQAELDTFYADLPNTKAAWINRDPIQP